MTVLSTLTVGSVVPEQQIPSAIVKASPDFGVIGAVVSLDGRLSSDPKNSPLTYTWSFESVPIGSQVIGEAFRLIDEDAAVVSFSPDVVGEYVVNLVVSNGVFSSAKAQAVVSIRAILVPHAQGIVPDGKWLWSYIRDVWQGVDNREMFETLWSALIQLTGTELLKLYQADYNKSIRDIQDLYQRRWLSYEPETEIKVNGPDFFFGRHYAGTDASTVNLGLNGLLIVLSPSELIMVEGSLLQNVAEETIELLSSRNPLNLGSFNLLGQNAARNGYSLSPTDTVPDATADKVATDVKFLFAIQSKEWEQEIPLVGNPPLPVLMAQHGSPLDYLLPIWSAAAPGDLADVQTGDVIHMPTGPNKGFYRITSISGTYVTVDRAPPSYSDAASTHLANVYRPLRFKLTQPETLLTDTVAIPYNAAKDISSLAPGRLIVVNGQAGTVVRASLDTRQKFPMVIVTVEKAAFLAGLENLSWRTPPTLISTTQDFEADGLHSGDLLNFDLVQEGQQVVTLPLQVVGVDAGRIGFVWTNGEVPAGVVPPIPNSTYLSIAKAFGIDGVTENPDGTLTFTGTAAKYMATINSKKFQNTYWNTLLTPETDIQVNPTFQVKPKVVVRNRLIPVDETLRSIPLLQSHIVQPEVIVENGQTYELHKGQKFPVDGPPLLLKENIDYVIDGKLAFEGRLTFKTGSDIVEADGGDFVDRGIGPGDQFIIQEPITLERTYYIQAVLGPNKLKLTKAIPLYALDAFVTAKVQIQRRRDGHFIRFTPGGFTALSAAPRRLWAEVSFFDNNETVESNFGILVGLSRDDIAKVSSDLNYRQAVAGIMYAYLRGSSLDKVRLGAQILLGLPFAENKGIIRSIEPDYRLGTDGSPVLGRLLIEDVDSVNAPLGTLRIYTYPIDPVSILAGLETNPATGAPYAVGDIVEKFAPLSKGVEITDYLTNPLTGFYSAQRQLQQFHSVRLRVNDSFFTVQEMTLVSSFLKRITPSYVGFFVSAFAEFADQVDIQEKLTNKLSGVVVDNASMSLPPTLMLDSRSASGIHQVIVEDGAFWVRRSGSDLVSTLASNTVSVPTNGLLTPRVHEVFEAPLTEVGDKLKIFTGENQGLYDITGVTNGTLDVDGPTNGLQAATGQRYAVLRPIRSLIYEGIVASTVGDLVTFQTGGLRTKGVGPGDWLLDINVITTTPRGTITEVLESVPNSGVFDQVRVYPAPTGDFSGEVVSIVRSRVLESPFRLADGTIETVTIMGAAGNSFTVPTGTYLPTLLEFGDELEVQSGLGLEVGSTVMVLDPVNKVLASSALAPATTADVRLRKKNRSSQGMGWDAISLFDPTDVVDAVIAEDQDLASCTATSNIVPLQVEKTSVLPALDALGAPWPARVAVALNPRDLLVRPGDLLKLEGAGNGAVDVGYGNGVYPIAEVAPTDVRLTLPLTVTESVAWSIIRRR